MKKHNEQMKLMNALNNEGLRFRSNDLNPESIRQYYKRNGAGEFRLYVTFDVDVNSIVADNNIEANVEEVIIDNGFNTQKFPAFKITF